ncbi:acyltransferase family protein [Micromonospora qiuiae]|uniref:acyltransferase family protein n=1 Tax=Micromonospora qiuiae TaxID=502268 RepID=UPI00194FB8E2|nr:acyltransferase [Micromonospora qiuiae]
MTPPTVTRLESLTGLRAIAAAAVFGFHALAVGLVDTPVAQWLFRQGATGVSFFFLLSGFVLAWSTRPGDTMRRFWQRRLAKVWPNHAAAWAVALAGLVAAGTTVGVGTALATLLLLQAWVPDEGVYFGVNTVAWSLSCEAFFYALFPALWALARRLPERALWPTLAGVLALVWIVPAAALTIPADLRYWAIWVLPAARLPEFVAGILLARLVAAGRWPRWASVGRVAVLVVAAYLASWWLPELWRLVAGTVVPLALLVAAVAARDVQGRRSWLRSRPAVVAGEWSYAFYLLHLLVLSVLVKAVGDNRPLLVELAVVLVALAVAVAASGAMYRLVEVPGMRLLRPRPIAPIPDSTARPGVLSSRSGG